MGASPRPSPPVGRGRRELQAACATAREWFPFSPRSGTGACRAGAGRDYFAERAFAAGLGSAGFLATGADFFDFVVVLGICPRGGST